MMSLGGLAGWPLATGQIRPPPTATMGTYTPLYLYCSDSVLEGGMSSLMGSVTGVRTCPTDRKDRPGLPCVQRSGREFMLPGSSQ